MISASRARGSSGGNFRSSEWNEHLHHRQRIANLVGDLGGEQTERAEPFVAAQLFFDVDDLLVQPRVFDGDGGEIGQRGQGPYVLIRIAIRRRGVHVERADGGVRPRSSARTTARPALPCAPSRCADTRRVPARCRRGAACGGGRRSRRGCRPPATAVCCRYSAPAPWQARSSRRSRVGLSSMSEQTFVSIRRHASRVTRWRISCRLSEEMTDCATENSDSSWRALWATAW